MLLFWKAMCHDYTENEVGAAQGNSFIDIIISPQENVFNTEREHLSLESSKYTQTMVFQGSS